MPLPILGIVAQAVVRSGAPAAALKYGAKAVKAAKKEIDKRAKAIDKIAEKERVARSGNKHGRPSELQRRQMEINSNARKFSREFGESLKKGGKAEKNWIQKAIKNPGSLRKKAGVKKGEDISKKELNKLSKSRNKTTQKQANLAKTLSKMNTGGKARGCGMAVRGTRKARNV